jgi:hypothetical protein
MYTIHIDFSKVLLYYNNGLYHYAHNPYNQHEYPSYGVENDA